MERRKRAIRKATSNDGEYLLPSIALMVCRVTPMRLASSCCVISPLMEAQRAYLVCDATGARAHPTPPPVEIEP